MSDLETPVWQLLGITGSRPGLLSLQDGVLSFQSDEGGGFECPLKQITEVRWPWYSFNAGLNLKANGQKYRLSFARPNGAGAAWLPSEAGEGVFGLGGAIRKGKTWKAALAEQMA